MSEAELDKCLEKLRYVSAEEYVLASDMNTRVECLESLRDVLAEKAPGDPLVDELDSILAKLRYVRSGDIILPEDHNLVVDALKKARDVLAELEKALIIQPAYGLTIGTAVSPSATCPEPLRLVEAPPLIAKTLMIVDIGYTSPTTELLIEINST